MGVYRIQVVWADGEVEYVANAAGQTAEFRSKADAQYWAEGFRMGMDQGDVQSVSVVLVPNKKAKR